MVDLNELGDDEDSGDRSQLKFTFGLRGLDILIEVINEVNHNEKDISLFDFTDLGAVKNPIDQLSSQLLSNLFM